MGHTFVADVAAAVASEFVKFILRQFEKVHRALNSGRTVKTDRLEHRVSERDVEGGTRVWVNLRAKLRGRIILKAVKKPVLFGCCRTSSAQRRSFSRRESETADSTVFMSTVCMAAVSCKGCPALNLSPFPPKHT